MQLCKFALVGIILTAFTACKDEQDLSKYRQMYAKPVSQWSKPSIDESVKDWEEFAPIPSPPVPKDNEFIHTKAHLGRNLFNEVKLSKSGQISCESCHRKEMASSDNLPRSVGHNGQIHRRNAPSTQMAAFFPELFWDGRAKSLEEQVLGPLTDATEMANTIEAAEEAIKNSPEYYPLFVASFGDEEMKKVWAKWYAWILPKTQQEEDAAKKAIHTHSNTTTPKKEDFLGLEKLGKLDATTLYELKEQERNIFNNANFKRAFEPTNKAQTKALPEIPQSEIEKVKKLITIENIAKAIATFERGPGIMGARNTRFNAFLKGDYEALSDEELYGLDLFRHKAGCMNCHYGSLLSDKKFHNIGLDFYGRALQDLGRYEVTKNPADVGAFKTPSLVNISKTAPYMHNGISPNLIGVIQLFNEGVPVPLMKGAENDALKPTKSPLIKALNLNADEIKALNAFLKTL